MAKSSLLAFEATPDDIRRQPSDFAIKRTRADWTWAGETRPGLPILHYPDGSNCEPFLCYFGHSAEIARVAISSMGVEAYAIREFICFLWNRGLGWEQADDRQIRAWREEQREAAEQVAKGEQANRSCAPIGLRKRKRVLASAGQIERKIAFVVGFYSLLPEALCLDCGGDPIPTFVGGANSKKHFAITTKIVTVLTPFGRRQTLRWIGSPRPTRGQVRRGVPRREVVDVVLARLRGGAMLDPTGRPTQSASEQSRQSAERDWLGARCQAEASLRSEEVVKLTDAALSLAVYDEGISTGLPRRSDGRPRLLGELPIGEARDRIIAGLEGLEASGRRTIGVEVTCKGRMRKAPFPIPLVRDLLRIGLWTVRAAQIRNWTDRNPDYIAPPHIFLSFKTGLGLGAGAFGDIVKAAFEAEGLRGSGHRLRAFCGTELAHRLLRSRLAMNGYRYDLSVETWVLRHVAEAMGHAQPNTTTAFYVDKALMRLVGAPEDPVLSGMVEIHRALSESGSALTTDDLARILRNVSVSHTSSHNPTGAPIPTKDGGSNVFGREDAHIGIQTARPPHQELGRPRILNFSRQGKLLVRRRAITHMPRPISKGPKPIDERGVSQH